MTKPEAKKIIKKNNADRKALIKWQDACWRTSPSSDSYKIYRQRYSDAKKALEDNIEIHREALSVFLGKII